MSGSNCIVPSVHELTKVLDGLAAVDHLSFTVSHGEIVGLLGVNSSNKQKHDQAKQYLAAARQMKNEL